jgi:hypothetical protein
MSSTLQTVARRLVYDLEKGRRGEVLLYGFSLGKTFLQPVPLLEM